MTIANFTGFKWCDTAGSWHNGFPQSHENYTAVQGCDSKGDWSDCTRAMRDGTVEGTRGNDVIDFNHTGDPDGDQVDHNDAVIAGVMSANSSLEQKARQLIVAANEAGGRDNISVVLVQAKQASVKRGLLSRMLGK